MQKSEYKQILADLDALIIKFELIETKNGKNDSNAENLNILIRELSFAFEAFEVNDDKLEDD